jgi:putative spermidine/putrescine transport system ATP-binding protein
VVRTFHGAVTRLTVRLDDGEEIWSDLPSPSASGLQPGRASPVSIVDTPVLVT